jgi:DNA-binding LacI/PurR family transcriptional regulator
MPAIKNGKAPATEKVVERIRRDLLGGQTAPDDYLPGERELAARYEVGRITVRRALRKLVAEGLVRPERGHGYRALLKSAAGRPGSPLVCVRNVEHLGPAVPGGVAGVVQEITMATDSQILTVGVRERSPEEVMRIIADAGAWGILLESTDRAMQRLLLESGLPCVAVDEVTTGLPMDCVLQDNHGGARLAAEHLLAKGHRRIAWFGFVADSNHSLERFTGAEAGFLRHGARIDPELIVDKGLEEAEAHELLSRKNRPTAVLAMWRGQAVAVARAARSLGLVLGRDLDLVGWSTEYEYRELLGGEFAGGPVPAMVVWDHRQMARIAIERLELRRQNPNLACVRITVSSRLVEG